MNVKVIRAEMATVSMVSVHLAANVMWAMREFCANKKLMNVKNINHVFMENVLTKLAITFANVIHCLVVKIVR